MINVRMKKQWLSVAAVCAGAAAAGVYSFIKGAGVLNKPRFHMQHDAVERYLEARHTGAKHAPIESCEGGWRTVISDTDGSKYDLFITMTQDGMFVFSEYKQ